MRKFEISDPLKKELNKLSKKDKSKYQATLKKIKEIVNSEKVEHYKNLRKPLQHLKRVHIDNSFVLTFSYNKTEDTIRFVEFDHHDNIYK